MSSPLWIDGAPRASPSRPPGLGEHSVEILREHGFSAEDVERLREAGAIGGPAPSDQPPPLAAERP